MCEIALNLHGTKAYLCV